MKIVILGSTGSIGDSTLDVVRNSKGRVQIEGLAAHSNREKLAAQAKEFGVATTVLTSEEEDSSKLEEMVSDSKTDTVVIAIVGFAALKPVMAALRAGKTVALANKEALVTCGEIITKTAQEFGGRIIPVDSEHNSLFQALQGHSLTNVQRLWITGSGGPFRGKTRRDLQTVTQAQALQHPNWKMGPKITIDSATLMNKGLEIIEARWLFDIPQDKVSLVIHPQSIVHGLVEFIDGSLMAHMSVPDMKGAISYALYYPERQPDAVKTLNLAQLKRLEFEEVDLETFPCIQLAQKALSKGGVVPTVLNASNEVAVQAFLENRIKFLDIPQVIEKALESAPSQAASLELVFDVDTWARIQTEEIISNL